MVQMTIINNFSQALGTIRNLRGLSEVKGKVDELLEAVRSFYQR